MKRQQRRRPRLLFKIDGLWSCLGDRLSINKEGHLLVWLEGRRAGIFKVWQKVFAEREATR